VTDIAVVPDPRSAPAIRWGIIAPGSIARRFAREIPTYTASSIVAVGSRDLGRAESFAQDFGIPRAHGSYEDLVADPEVDAVYVASPHSEHRDHAILALEAGKPVLVEKAFTINARQAGEVFAVAERRGLFVMEAMWSRFLPHYQTLKKLIDEGDLGAIRTVMASHCQSLNLDPAWRMWNPALAGGALLDLGVYPLSCFHYLFGRPSAIVASGILTESGVDLKETITLRYGTDVLAAAINDMSAAGVNRLSIVGDAGRADVADWFYTPQDIKLTRFRESIEGPERLPTATEGGFQFEAAEAARCIVAGKTESSIMSWQDTLDVMVTMDEVRRQLGAHFPGE
jgi:predicted dehydrogenase